MSVRRQLNGDGRRRITIIEEPEEERLIERQQPRRTAPASTTAEEELMTVTRHSPWGITLGWLRMAAAWVALFLLIIETGLVFRLIFALADANTANRFVDFIYSVTGPLVAPFEGILAERSVNGGVFEPETVIAMGVWAILGLFLIALIWVASTAPFSVRKESRISRERHRHTERIEH